MKPIRTWVLICNATGARIVEQNGVRGDLVEVAGTEFNDTHIHNRDIVADRPGRSFDSEGSGRHAMSPSSDPQKLREQAFLAELADFAANQHADGRFDRLIVVASPSALGYLRSILSDAVRHAISAELAKDLTKVPNSQLAQHLESVLAT